jgi:D-cysteine desulfhydrase
MTPSTSSRLPILERWPTLGEAVPHLPIGQWPTPISPAANFSTLHQLDSFFIKHEDQSHPLAGGNKVRGLEFILAHAKSLKARTIVTLGAAGSYHVCRTAFHAHALGIRTVAVMLPQPPAEYVCQNLALGHSLGVGYVPATFISAGPRLIGEMLRPRNWCGSRPPYYVPPGGSSSRACIGHVNAALELKAQISEGRLPEPDYLYVAMGSIGTAAGLLLGCRLAGLRTRVVGVAVSYPWYCTASRCARMARRILRFMRRYDSSVPELDFDGSDMDVVRSALGPGYALFTDESQTLARQLHDADGVALDGTYTAKTLHGAMEYIRVIGLQAHNHLFWNSYQPTRADTIDIADRMVPAFRHYFTEDFQSHAL